MGQWQRSLDSSHASFQFSRFDKNDFETELAIGLLVNAFKSEGFLEADAAGFSGRDEAKITHEENGFVIDGFAPYAVEFAGKFVRDRVTKIGG